MTAGLDLQLDYLPRLPRRKDWRIGCIGAGFIMRDCHLVAYRQAGFNPVAIAARRPEQAREVAALHKLPRVHDTVAALLADTDIEILDVAVPPDRQAALIRQAVEHKGSAARHPGAEAARPFGRGRAWLCRRLRAGRDCVGGQPEHALRPVGAGDARHP